MKNYEQESADYRWYAAQSIGAAQYAPALLYPAAVITQRYPAMMVAVVGFFGLGLVANAIFAIRDARRYKADVGRMCAVHTLGLAPWLAFIPLWEILTTRTGLAVMFPILFLVGCLVTFLTFSSRRLHSPSGRRKLMQTASMIWTLGAVLVLAACFLPSGWFAFGARPPWAIAVIAPVCAWLSVRFWRAAGPRIPDNRASADLTPASPSGD